MTFKLSDNRTLGYAFYGLSDSSAKNIFYFHGFPSSRLEAAVLGPSAANLHIRIISIDRPGMGLSTFQKGRTALDWPKDVLELADHLNINKFSILAYSGGALYALACAQVIPHSRLLAIEIMSAAFSTVEISPFNIMAPFKDIIGKGMNFLVEKSLDSQFGKAARSSDTEAYYELCAKDMLNHPKVDQDAIRGVEKMFRWDPLREAFRVDSHGVGLDIRLLSKWKIDYNDIKCGSNGVAIKIWYGGMDASVSGAEIEALYKKLDGAEIHTFPEEGHMGILIHHGRDILKHASAIMKT